MTDVLNLKNAPDIRNHLQDQFLPNDQNIPQLQELYIDIKEKFPCGIKVIVDSTSNHSGKSDLLGTIVLNTLDENSFLNIIFEISNLKKTKDFELARRVGLLGDREFYTACQLFVESKTIFEYYRILSEMSKFLENKFVHKPIQKELEKFLSDENSKSENFSDAWIHYNKPSTDNDGNHADQYRKQYDNIQPILEKFKNLDQEKVSKLLQQPEIINFCEDILDNRKLIHHEEMVSAYQYMAGTQTKLSSQSKFEMVLQSISDLNLRSYFNNTNYTDIVRFYGLQAALRPITDLSNEDYTFLQEINDNLNECMSKIQGDNDFIENYKKDVMKIFSPHYEIMPYAMSEKINHYKMEGGNLKHKIDEYVKTYTPDFTRLKMPDCLVKKMEERKNSITESKNIKLNLD
jgi:hypothetical protein